jgi:hypothetical protein
MLHRTQDTRAFRFAEAYREMARTAKYRPEALSDDDGDINDPQTLAEEADRYGKCLEKQDDDLEFPIIGCTHWDHNKLFVYLLNASQLCFSGTDALPVIKRLVQMSLEEISRIENPHRVEP